VNISDKERVLLINQYKILASLDSDEQSHYLELIEILERGYEIFYSLIDDWIAEPMPASQGTFVLDVLDLYRRIEDTKRSTQDPKLLQHNFGVFRGFDGNNEPEYMSFCRFLIHTQGKFQEQLQYVIKNDNFNSHMPMRDKYERMLAAAQEIRERQLSSEQAIKIASA
jgi:uncharacterized protein YfbU (UPF0304 family)